MGFLFLKKDGNAIISIHFFVWEHQDYVRLTARYVQEYLNNWNKVSFKIIKLGNKYTSFYDILRFIKYEPNTKKLNKLNALGRYILMILFYLGIKVLNLEEKRDSFYAGVFLLCIKI